MSEMFDPLAGSVPPWDTGEPWTTYLDPTVFGVRQDERWEARAAEWRARALAELVFDGEVAVRLTGHAQRGLFRGLLHLDVPFRGLTDHRSREERFLAAAESDPVLSRVPFVFVFGAA